MATTRHDWKEMPVIRHAGLILAMFTIALALPAGVPAQMLGTYDTFSDPDIDPFSWRGQDSTFTATLGVRNTESIRRITDDKLRLFLRSFGSDGTDVGTSGNGNNRVFINDPPLLDGDPQITALQAQITPKAAVNQDCQANTAQGVSRARILGFFFNDGTANATPGDLVGDIIAGVHLEQNSKLGKRIVAFISRCDQAPCSR